VFLANKGNFIWGDKHFFVFNIFMLPDKQKSRYKPRFKQWAKICANAKAKNGTLQSGRANLTGVSHRRFSGTDLSLKFIFPCFFVFRHFSLKIARIYAKNN
jgi:hypothetical protein